MEYPSYNPASDYLPLSDDELSTLDDLLSELPSDEAMNIEAMDGYLTGLLLSPRPLAERAGADWLPVIWGGDGEGAAPFASGKQKKRAQLLILRHLRSLAVQIGGRQSEWEPIFSIAEHEDEELTDAEDWCIGFMLAVDLDGEAWAGCFDDERQGAALAPIALLGGDESQLSPEQQARLADVQMRDALSREIPDSVLALWTLRHPA